MIEFLEARIAPAVLLTHAGQLANDQDAPNVVTTDFSGNIFVAGVFRETIDFNLGTKITNLTATDTDFGDIYVAKYDADYRLLWVKTWGGAGTEAATDITLDFNNDVYVSGTFASTNAGFNGAGPLNASTDQAFLFKLDGETGNAETAFNGDGQLTFGNGANPSHGNTVIRENSGTILFGGDYLGNGSGINGSGTFPSAGQVNGFVVRIDATTGQQLFTLGSSQGGIVRFAGGEIGTFRSVFRIEVGEGTDIFIGENSHAGPGVVRYDPAGTAPVETYGNLGFVPLGDEGVIVADFILDNAYQVTGVNIDSDGNIHGFRYFSGNGNLDPTFGLNAGAGEVVIPLNANSVSLATDHLGRIYLAGEKDGQDYLVRLNSGGALDSRFGNNGQLFFGNPGTAESSNQKVGIAIDSEDYVILRGGYVGNPDLDPSVGVKKLPARYSPGGESPDLLEESFLLRIDPSGVKAGQPLILSVGFPEIGPNDEMFVITSLTGPGRAHVYENSGFGDGSIGYIELFDTTLASNLRVATQNGFTSRTVGAISTHGSLQHVGSISLSSDLIFGEGPNDFLRSGGVSELIVSGKINSLTLGDIRGGSYISLGRGLPYNEPDTTTPDTYNNRPNLTLGNILDDGVTIDVTGDGFTPQGVGGGGLGEVVVQSWAFPGLVRTTQSIGSFTVLHGDFFADLEVDRFHLGESTTANVGEMTIQDGNWGSSGTEIEGNVGAFNAEAFLAGASIIAGSISTINVDGLFAGTVVLTDENANAFGSFSVATDFTGKVTSLASLKKLNIKGDFKGSLTAPSIASITAFAFFGSTAEDGEGDPNKLNITTTAGLLGKITAKSGVIKDFEFNTPLAFGGIKVALKNLTSSTVGIENVSITASSIGPIEVTLAGKANVPGVNLTGISNSSFTTTGKMGNVTVKISGATGQSLGLSNASFAADTIGKVTVSVSKGGGANAQAHAIDVASFTALQTIAAVNIGGTATTTQVNQLKISAGKSLASFTVSAKDVTLGSLIGSSVLAGQNVDLVAMESAAVLQRRVAAAALGAVKISGSVESSVFASGGNMAQVTVGGFMLDSLILGSAILGADGALGGKDVDSDRFHSGGQMAGVTIKGALGRTTISNGISPVNGVIGDADDVTAPDFEGFEVIAAIKSISIGSSLTASANPPVDAHTFAFQANALGKLTIGKTKFTDFTVPLLLLAGEGEGADDIVVRLI